MSSTASTTLRSTFRLLPEAERRDSKENSHAHAYIYSGQIRPSRPRSRLSPYARGDGDHLPVLRIPEMVRIRSTGADPLYQQRPADLLDVSGIRHPGRQLVPGRFGMALWRPSVPWFLEQEAGHP